MNTAVTACRELLAWWDQPNPTLGEVIKWNPATREYMRPAVEPRYILLAREAIEENQNDNGARCVQAGG